ncbi:MAG: hypothetical protein M3Y27_10865 [Acidobacteriota bacterium]|nr:hypothetical protein [Acidobacteriota bacterium]
MNGPSGGPANAIERRTIGEDAKLSVVAYRPDPSEFDKPLTAAELKELHRRMSLLSPHHVQEAYRRALSDCQMEGDVLPRASAVQELVTAWKLMRAWKRRRAPRRD